MNRRLSWPSIAILNLWSLALLITVSGQSINGDDTPFIVPGSQSTNAPQASLQLLNIDFGKSPQAVPKTGRAAIGLSDQDIWNTFPNPWQTEMHVERLKWADGEASSIGYVLYDGPGNWSSDRVSDSMYADYAFSADLTAIKLVITNLPPGTYHFYVYAHGAVSNQNSAIQLSTDQASIGPFSTLSGPEWQSQTWQEGSQYVAFRSIALEAGQAVTLTSMPSDSSIAVLNGVQILRVTQAVRPPRLLNLDFGKEQSAPHKTGKAATGLSNQDYWNTFANPYQPELHVDRLKWSDGTESPMGFDLLNAGGNWGSDQVHDLMYADYAYPQDNGHITLVLRQLPADYYDFYIYAHGAADNQNSTIRLNTGSRDLEPRTTISGPDWKSEVWAEGRQYVLFSNVRVPTNQVVTIIITPDRSPYALLNGIQVQRAQALPDPYDGISTAWREKYFGLDWAINPDAVGKVDPDADGASNLEEFTMGTNPLDAGSVLYLTQIRRAPVITWASITNQSYQVMWKPTLQSPEWIALSPVIRATNSHTEFVDLSATNHQAIYRVRPVP